MCPRTYITLFLTLSGTKGPEFLAQMVLSPLELLPRPVPRGHLGPGVAGWQGGWGGEDEGVHGAWEFRWRPSLPQQERGGEGRGGLQGVGARSALCLQVSDRNTQSSRS